PSSPEVALALDWLVRTQEPDGSWDPAKWDGQPVYRVGLTGLALLALVGSEEDVTAGRYAGAIARATAFLLSEQKVNGRFGPFFSASVYNHGIATVALLERYARTRDERLKRPIEEALVFIGRHQDADGGWGYLDPERDANASVTAWQLHAVLLADALGWSQARTSAQKALAWIESTVDAQGRAGYSRAGDFRYGPQVPTAIAAFFLSGKSGGDARGRQVAEALGRLPWEGARADPPVPNGGEGVDFYRAYFLTLALGALRGRDDAGLSRTQVRDAAKLAQLRDEVTGDLVERQLTEGPDAGSWDPTDRWSPAGGRVYATAMAALSLQAGTRTTPFAAEPR
ncbi:MAG TPA: prenyltransferase/squalene oxidase repeat-containing protein, partial [Planctomycetota bacterium]|nr:prenyltransferase/squalene oxidase repeat-containing protein [Planctomycetota bacterium]